MVLTYVFTSHMYWPQFREILRNLIIYVTYFQILLDGLLQLGKDIRDEHIKTDM